MGNSAGKAMKKAKAAGHEAMHSAKKAGTSLEAAGNRGAGDIKGSMGGGRRSRRRGGTRKKKRRRRRKVGGDGFSLFGKGTSDDGKSCIPGVPGQCGMGTRCVRSGLGIEGFGPGKCISGGRRKKKSKRRKKSHRRRTHRRRRRR